MFLSFCDEFIENEVASVFTHKHTQRFTEACHFEFWERPTPRRMPPNSVPLSILRCTN